MVQLSPQELEEIIDTIEDPLERTKEGMKLFRRGGTSNQDSFSKYAESYLQMMIQGGEAVSSEYQGNYSREPVTDVLSWMPKDRAKELVKVFVDKRIADFREQTSINPVRFGDLKDLIEKYELADQTYELCIFANEVLEPSWHDKVEIPEERLDEVLNEVLNIVRSAKQNGRIRQVRGVFNDERFQAKYATEGEAREIALEMLSNDLMSEHSIHFKGVRDFIDTYSLTDVTPAVREAVVHQLSNGKLQQAGLIMAEFGYTTTPEDSQAAKSTMNARLEELVKIGKIPEIIRQKQLMKRFTQYEKEGLNQDDVPQVVLPEGYRGKFVVAEFGGKEYFRVERNGDGSMTTHEIILGQFSEELQLYGFNADLRKHSDGVGGAHLNFNKDGSIEIYGSSDGLGACDKEKAKELISSLYQDREVVIKTENRGGW